MYTQSYWFDALKFLQSNQSKSGEGTTQTVTPPDYQRGNEPKPDTKD